MKISELWLREWINPALTREQLCHCLTMSGLEVEEAAPVAEKFDGVVIAQIAKVDKHPEADRLHVCEVDVGGKDPLVIVCGARNVSVGMKVAAALDGALLPKEKAIKISKLRGVTSQGMLCAMPELGLAEEGEGLFELPPDAPIGTNLWEYLKLNDYVIDISITPNRGDCLSVLGLAHEISALTETRPNIPKIKAVTPTITDTLKITIAEPNACARYVGRVIRNVKADATTPMWLQEQLRRSGIRCISPVVDVMNYVMLELGQPMHAFDLAKISGSIHVRMAHLDESLELLDGQTVKLNPETLVIADEKKSLAIAGVMGGMESAVNLLTKDVFLESAYFSAANIARAGRQFNLGSESSYRFERGVDPLLQADAIERATQLILDIADGMPGPIIDVVMKENLPQPKVVTLRLDRIKKILGIAFSNEQVEKMLQRLHFSFAKSGQTWQVTVPARRFDINLEEDLIEELARMLGYDAIPTHKPYADLRMTLQTEKKLPHSTLRQTLCDLGYNEVITYSFVDKKIQALLDPEMSPKELLNPISSDMSVMRTSLWPGLLNVLKYNLNRQQPRVRIFEMGLRFLAQDKSLLQQNVVSGLMSGDVYPSQWGHTTRAVDFFDLKGDIENLLNSTLKLNECTFKPGTHPALHPGQTAEIYHKDQYVGIVGRLHPSIAQSLDVSDNIFVFEMLLAQLETANVPRFSEISKFPDIRRDIAILVKRDVTCDSICQTIREAAGELLQNVEVFDIYQGKGINPEQKSVALSLTWQHFSRTLVEGEIVELMDRVVGALKEKFAAELRG